MIRILDCVSAWQAPALPDRRQVGGKAWALLQLMRAGFPVPPFFVVLPPSDPLNTQPLTDVDFQARLQAAVQALCPDGMPLAVRSSGIEEDGAAHSYAGQFETYLGILPEEVPDRIAAVWHSAHNGRLAAYRQQLGEDPQTVAWPAVIVQRMVPAETAGVAFGANPVSGRRSEALVAAVYGLGTALVSGDSNADTWRVSHTGRILEGTLGEKTTAHRLNPDGTMQILDVPPEASGQWALNEPQVLSVARLCLDAGDFFQRPQDIEWAVANGQLYLLQARPLTTLHTVADPDGRMRMWDNSQLIDCYSGVTTPLTFSFARRFYTGYYSQLCRALGQTEAQIARLRPAMERMLGYIRHRIYYNVGELSEVLGPLPNRDSLREKGIRHWPRKVAYVWRMIRLYRQLPADIDRFYQRVNALLNPGGQIRPNLAPLRADQLANYYEDLEGLLQLDWQAVVVNDYLANLLYDRLQEAVVHWCGDGEGILTNDLLCGETGIISLEPTRQIQAMAELAARDVALCELLATVPTTDALRPHLGAYPDFAHALDEYLRAFGDRGTEDLKLESEPIGANPLPLLRQIAAMAQSPAPSERVNAQVIRREAETKALRALTRHPLRRFLFGWLLRATRWSVRQRENMRFEMTRMTGRIRQIFQQLGRRFCEEGWLERPDDIFYLTVEEVLGLVHGTAASWQWRATVAERRADLETSRRQPNLPMQFATTGMVPAGNTFDPLPGETTDATESDASGRRGQGCAPGVVRGRIRKVLDPDDARLEQGEILLAERSDPGWVILFPAAGGLLFEHGHALCHAAIVAREMGLPTVVALPGLSAWLQDGDWVEMDGRSGWVRKIDPPAFPDKTEEL